jgi:hypothetical protein
MSQRSARWECRKRGNSQIGDDEEMGHRRKGKSIMSKSFLSIAFATALLGIVAYGQEQQGYTVSSGTNHTTSASEIAVFPVRYSLNGRYLVDQNDTPFPIMGRTAWFVTSLSVGDYHIFIDDTAARGYDAIELHVVNHDPRGNHPPFNGNGDLPFLTQGHSPTGTSTRKRPTSAGPTKLTGAWWMDCCRIVKRRAFWFSCSPPTQGTSVRSRAGCRNWWQMVPLEYRPTAPGSRRGIGTRRTWSG